MRRKKFLQDGRLANQCPAGSASRPLDNATSFANMYDRFQSTVMDERGHEFLRTNNSSPPPPPPTFPESRLWRSDHDLSLSHPHSWPGSSCVVTPGSQINLSSSSTVTAMASCNESHVHNFVDYLQSSSSPAHDHHMGSPAAGEYHGNNINLHLDLTMSTGSCSEVVEELPHYRRSPESSLVELNLSLDLAMSIRWHEWIHMSVQSENYMINM